MKSFFAKEPLITGLFCRIKIRYPIGLRHPVCRYLDRLCTFVCTRACALEREEEREKRKERETERKREDNESAFPAVRRRERECARE